MPCRSKPVEVLGHGAPAPVEAGLGRRSSPRAARAAAPASRRRPARSARPSWPSTSSVTPWCTFAACVGVRQQLQVGVRVHVDEARAQRRARRASIVRRAGSSSARRRRCGRRATPTSARYQGLPAPSITRPPRKQRSSTAQTSASRFATKLARHARLPGGSPPSTGRTSPLIHDASSEARKAAAATSSGRRRARAGTSARAARRSAPCRPLLPDGGADRAGRDRAARTPCRP